MHISKLIAAADPRGDIEAVRRVAHEAGSIDANAILLVGSLTPKGTEPRQYGLVLKALADPNRLSVRIRVDCVARQLEERQRIPVRQTEDSCSLGWLELATHSGEQFGR